VPRRIINLTTAPRVISMCIAASVAGFVMLVAWHIGRARATPGWLLPIQAFWPIIGPLLIVFFLARWLWTKPKK
jgi:hypothetical protein